LVAADGASRRPLQPEAKPRFEPVSEDAWDKSFSIGIRHLCGVGAHEHQERLVFNE
jgi:hypothetical protein